MAEHGLPSVASTAPPSPIRRQGPQKRDPFGRQRFEELLVRKFFCLNANGWARHEELGWIFPVESPTAGLWLWKRDLGWLWTEKEIYPFLYATSTGGWLYFYGEHRGTRLFYDYVRKKWTTLKEN